MYAEPLQKSLLREALNIAGFGRALEPMQEKNLTYRRNMGLMFVDEDGRTLIDLVKPPLRGKAHGVDFSRPEVAGDREEVRIFEDGLKGPQQIQF